MVTGMATMALSVPRTQLWLLWTHHECISRCEADLRQTWESTCLTWSGMLWEGAVDIGMEAITLWKGRMQVFASYAGM